MIITTTDPIAGEILHNIESKPFVAEGKGSLAARTYFEPEETRRTYLPVHDNADNTMGHYCY